jgi:hypothetical protein
VPGSGQVGVGALSRAFGEPATNSASLHVVDCDYERDSGGEETESEIHCAEANSGGTHSRPGNDSGAESCPDPGQARNAGHHECRSLLGGPVRSNRRTEQRRSNRDDDGRARQCQGSRVQRHQHVGITIGCQICADVGIRVC